MTTLTAVPKRASELTQEQRNAIVRPPGLRSAGIWVWIAIAVVLGALVVFPFMPGIRFYYLQVVILVFWYATLGTAWGIAGGYGGSHSVGHAAFVGVGAYTSTILLVDYNVTPWLGIFAGMAVAALLAFAIGYPCFRRGLRGDYFTLATVAFGQVAYEIVNGWTSLTKGSQGIPISYNPDPLMFQFSDRKWFYFIAMALWLGTVVISYRLRKSRLGVEMLAVRDDEAAAARGGLSVLRLKLTSFILSAVIAAAAGTFYAQFFMFIDPSAVMGLTLSVQIILVAALGGMNSYLGGTVGALILIPISQWLASSLAGFPGADLALYGVALILLMLFMPFGILGLLRKSPRWRKVIGW